ncbi:Hypothetical predicted protein [Mytilus galloprovincialis]|uniref:RRM domain-containing protein n=1 Tax=Mytilus galloprovincialis TaxID=29158 RepID=A0A8B6C692_MYTGA|nr:Hypothetical predicted protein [Mytilus galloprovincialis]
MFYSCFIGHLPSQVTKEELYNLFVGCGEIHDLFICEDSNKSSYNYGFVRYITSEQALKAVQELNNWPIHGTHMIVDIAKDTAQRIREEKKLTNDRMVKCTGPRPPPVCHKEMDSNTLVQDIMYLSRLKETCASLNYKVNSGLLGDENTKSLNVDKLLDKMAVQPLERIKTARGEFNEDLTPEKICERLSESDRKSSNVDISKTASFIKALKTVVGTVNSFLQEVTMEPNVPVDLMKNTGECLQSGTHQFEPGTSASKASVKTIHSVDLNIEQKDLNLRKLIQTVPVLQNSRDVSGDSLPASLSQPVLQHSNSEEIEDTSNSDSDYEGPSRDSGIESDALTARKHQASEGASSSDGFDGQSHCITQTSNEDTNTTGTSEMVLSGFVRQSHYITQETNSTGPNEIVSSKGAASLDCFDRQSHCIAQAKNTTDTCEMVSSRRSEKIDDCSIIESFLQNALKIGKNGEQNGQSIDEGKNKEESRKEYSSTVSVGRGIGRGVFGIYKK